MKNILVLGAGKIGALISGLLAESGDYRVQLADTREGAAAEVAIAHGLDNIDTFVLDAGDKDKLAAHVVAHKPIAVVSSLPYFCNVSVAEVARDAGLHYFDLTEDVPTTKAIIELSATAKGLMAPQCGLAPGFVGIVAAAQAAAFEQCRSIKMRVGALPQHPAGLLSYAFNWSPEGVVNEYLNDCEVIEDGRHDRSAALVRQYQNLDHPIGRCVRNLSPQHLEGRDDAEHPGSGYKRCEDTPQRLWSRRRELVERRHHG